MRAAIVPLELSFFFIGSGGRRLCSSLFCECTETFNGAVS